jgi:hypothetical protein
MVNVCTIPFNVYRVVMINTALGLRQYKAVPFLVIVYLIHVPTDLPNSLLEV